MEIIRSKSNALVKQAKKLHQKKHRIQSYLIEGWHLLEEALTYGASLEWIFVLEEDVARLAGRVPEEQVRLVSCEVLQELADSPSPQGVVAQVALPQQSFPDKLEGKYLVLEDVQDPGNVGTMIRTADAAGFAGVLISDKTADIYNLKVLRSMQGSHFHVPIYRLPMEQIMAEVKKAGMPLLATTLSSRSVDYRSLPILTEFALVMGNEGQGISEQVATAADSLVHIAMPGQAESLNVAVAAGILLFHFVEENDQSVV